MKRSISSTEMFDLKNILLMLCFIYSRKCESSQVFVKDGLTHCIDSCKKTTLCGEVEVPEDHLDVRIEVRDIVPIFF